MSYASGTERDTELDIFEVRNLTEIVRFGSDGRLEKTKTRVWNIPEKDGIFPMGMVMTQGVEESFGLVLKIRVLNNRKSENVKHTVCYIHYQTYSLL